MKIAFFSTQPYDKTFFELHNFGFGFTIEYYETPLNEKTVNLLDNVEVVCVFVNDQINRSVMEGLSGKGIKMIALRCAGFNNVDLEAAKEFNIKVVRVPAYSPYAVAEHAVAMIMTLNRKTHKAYIRVREQNFSLNGLLGFDLHGKTVGVIGTGNIGQLFCTIMNGFGCNVLAYDIHPNEKLVLEGVKYVPLAELFTQSDIISLHCPLNEHTRYIINDQSIQQMKKGVMLINTSRGALIDTRTVIQALKSKVIGSLGIDVYEQEEKLFFRDLSQKIIQDDMITRLSSFPNVLITSHQGFFTQEALTQIAITTLSNIKSYQNDQPLINEVKF
jgi:D-lactate dehydrogenase